MVAVVGIVLALAMYSFSLIAGFLATFLPGLAVLQFARAKKSFFAMVAGVLLLAAPLVVVVGSEERFMVDLKNHRVDFAYALCFFPGLLILLHSAKAKAPYLGLRAAMLYLAALFLLAGFASGFTEVYRGLLVFVVLGAFLIALADHLESVLLGRLVGLALLLAPVAATVTMALPRHLELNGEMEVACAAGAGLSISAASAPISVIAMELSGINDGSHRACPQGCFRPVWEGWLAAIEVGGDGWGRPHLPPGLYRFQARLPEEVKSAGFSPPMKREACYRRARVDGKRWWCTGFWPIDALSADYLVRRRSTVPSFAGIYSESFEIVERSSGEPVAQTTGFYMTEDNRGSLLAVPLHQIVPRDDPCSANGPHLIPFIEAFVRASHGPAGQSSNR